ncbi:MAG: isoamylase early set domain-containing protein [Gemmatimonadales bacterium]
MPEPDTPDPLIQAVARELRRPAGLRPDLEQRAMADIHAGLDRRRLWNRARWAGLALAAGIAGWILIRPGPAPETIAAGSPTPALRPVEFSIKAPAARHVAVVGDFNDWDPAATPLVRATPDGRWTTAIPLHPGRYAYTFVVDGRRWLADPDRPRALGDDFGEPTSVVTVPERSSL